MKREVDLLLYLPSIVKRYYEMQKIMAAENPEFQLLWDADELIRQNLYIVTAQEEGLRRYEKILGIYPSPDDNLETRRTRVIMRWNDFTPYTLRYLIGLLTVLTNGDFQINTNFSEYEIEIIVHLGVSGAVDDLGYIIKQILPCNLTILSKNEINISAPGEVQLGLRLLHTEAFFITNDFNSEYALAGHMNNNLLLAQSTVYQANNDFHVKYSANGQINSGFNVSAVSEIVNTNDFNKTISVDGSIKSGSSIVVITENKL